MPRDPSPLDCVLDLLPPMASPAQVPFALDDAEAAVAHAADNAGPVEVTAIRPGPVIDPAGRVNS